MSEWIDICRELPESDFEVLVNSDDDVSISIFRVDHNGMYWFDIEKERGWSVSHWMPLPAPHK